MSRTSALTRKPKGLGKRNFAQGTPGHMRLPHRLQGQKVKSQGHGAGAYCGGDLAAQLVMNTNILNTFITLHTLKDLLMSIGASKQYQAITAVQQAK